MTDFTLEQLKSEIVAMGQRVEEMLLMAFDTQKTFNDIVPLEKSVNDFHKHIDDHVYKYLALKGPVASDLRCALVCLKINTELERLGDYALSLKKFFIGLTHQNEMLLSCLLKMKGNVCEALRQSLDSFIFLDTTTSRDIIQKDNEIDQMYGTLSDLTMAAMHQDLSFIKQGFIYIRMGKIFERMGDHLTNIAEDIIFWVDGDDIRHSK